MRHCFPAALQQWTGIAIEFEPAHGAIVKDRSSLASKGIRTSVGVIDAGYRGPVKILMTLDMNAPPSSEDNVVGGYVISAGDKIAQLSPAKPLTIFEGKTEVLTSASRGEKGFGGSGK